MHQCKAEAIRPFFPPSPSPPHKKRRKRMILTLLTTDRFLHGNELETIGDGTFKQFKVLNRW